MGSFPQTYQKKHLENTMKPPWFFCCGWWSPWCLIDEFAHRWFPWTFPSHWGTRPDQPPGEAWVCRRHDKAVEAHHERRERRNP